MDIQSLQSRFGIDGAVAFESGEGGLPKVNITAAQGQAEIYLHGAHVTQFQPRGQQRVLFLSNQSVFQPEKAIRGGIPIIFPWFGSNVSDPSAPMHGFARTMNWQVAGTRLDQQGVVTVTLGLASDRPVSNAWPHTFKLRFDVSVGQNLDLNLTVENISATSFQFEEALHTYLLVGDVRRASVEGLDDRRFVDKVDGFREKAQPPGPFAIGGETDRVYLDTADSVAVIDPVMNRTLRVQKESTSLSTVIWNPWIAKAKTMGDFGDEEWPSMICVETANVGKNTVTLAAGSVHSMASKLVCEPLQLRASIK